MILEKCERKIRIKMNSNGNYSFGIILVLTFLLVGVISGMFKYHMLAIVSNSMVPEFSRGDAVLIEKINDKELGMLKKGDIIAFYDTSGRMVIHRIVLIEDNNGEYFIKTKGDNNDSIDSWTLTNDNIYGKVLISLKYIGIPSVELSELINR